MASPAASVRRAGSGRRDRVRDRVRVTLGAGGVIEQVQPDADPLPGDERLAGLLVPGIANLHSHAFQRAMAGLAERAGPEGDNFWRWRDVMYRFLAVLSPEDVEAIAAQLYAECLRHGYTAVAEFHYLHNAPDGTPYDDPAELSLRILAAAERARNWHDPAARAVPAWRVRRPAGGRRPASLRDGGRCLRRICARA